MTRRQFTDITGIKKSTFYDKYRWSPRWQRELDMRIHADTGRLTMDRDASEDLRRRLMGPRAGTKSSPRARRLGKHAQRGSIGDDKGSQDSSPCAL